MNNQQYPQNPQYGQPQYGQPQYGQPQYPQYPQGGMPPRPDSYLVWAILTTVLCCMPLGIVAIVKSSQVESRYNQGDYAGAQKASEDAKKWCIY